MAAARVPHGNGKSTLCAHVRRRAIFNVAAMDDHRYEPAATAIRIQVRDGLFDCRVCRQEVCDLFLASLQETPRFLLLLTTA